VIQPSSKEVAFKQQIYEKYKEHFNPFLKLGCIIWELRTKVTGEPLERNYVAGCRELGEQPSGETLGKQAGVREIVWETS
jgi:hypothetical protein